MKLLVLVTVVVLGMSVLACGGDGAERDDSGQIVSTGSVGVFDFKVGDCFQDPQAGDSPGIAGVEGVPCSTAHDYEVYLLHDLSGNDFPGVDEVDRASSAACLAGFEPYVGRDYDSSRLNYTWLSPTEETWEENDDREVVCALHDLEHARLTGSMKGSGE